MDIGYTKWSGKIYNEIRENTLINETFASVQQGGLKKILLPWKLKELKVF